MCSATVNGRCVCSTNVNRTRVCNTTVNGKRVCTTNVYGRRVCNTTVNGRRVCSTNVYGKRVSSTTVNGRRVGSTTVNSRVVCRGEDGVHNLLGTAAPPELHHTPGPGHTAREGESLTEPLPPTLQIEFLNFNLGVKSSYPAIYFTFLNLVQGKLTKARFFPPRY